MDGKSLNITQERIAQLKALFPEVFAEDKIDFEKLKTVLGADTLAPEERYELNWAGKYEAFKEVQKQTTATLIPDLDNSIDFENSENLFIEGENLEVLRILQKSYHNQVKMIYIDPPYNTGNDSFVYPDDYTERRSEYEARTGLTNDEGYLNKQDLWKKNSKENGQFHSVWLSMMYPRLYMARNLLRENGVIFVSIDDNEVSNLRLLLDGVFGEENFVAQIIWQRRITRENRKLFSTSHDYILAYVKNHTFITEAINLLPMTKDALGRYKNPDNDKRGIWTSVPAIAQGGHGTKNQFYTLITPSGREVYPPSGSCWRYTKEKMDSEIKKNNIWFGKDGQGVPRIKKFLNEGRQGLTPTTLWLAKEADTNDKGKRQLVELFDGTSVFDAPKPTLLLEQTLNIGSNMKNNDIVLDFFTGSGSLAHAVLDLNKQDGGNRKFICVQMPEPTPEGSEARKAGYETISQIAQARIHKVIEKLQAEQAEAANKPELFETENSPQDLGFKSFQLAPSNFKIWRNDATGEDLVKQLEAFQQPYREGAVTQNMLYEILLKAGRSLTVSIQPISIGEHTLYNIEDGSLLIALDAINTAIIDKVLALKPRTFITLDKLFQNDSELLTNTRLQFREQDIDFQVI